MLKKDDRSAAARLLLDSTVIDTVRDRDIIGITGIRRRLRGLAAFSFPHSFPEPRHLHFLELVEQDDEISVLEIEAV